MSEYDRIVKPTSDTFYIVHDGNGNGHSGHLRAGHVLGTAAEFVESTTDPETHAYMVESASLIDSLIPMPQVGEEVLKDTTYSYQGKAVVCYQSHTRQADWDPMTTPALFGLAHRPLEEWRQPVGAHDAYNIGDTVTFEGNTYRSLIDANVWSPAVYPAGWEII